MRRTEGRKNQWEETCRALPLLPKIRANGIAFADAIKAAGGSVEIVDLPQVGIKGNSHMVMMDKNNVEVAALIQKWLEGRRLTK